MSLIDRSKVAIGGESDANNCYIAPTVLVNVAAEDKVMQEEIFGPVLPILTAESYTEAIGFINAREKPLALYVFTRERKVFEEFQNFTSSGSVCLNECLLQVGCRFF